MAEKNKLQVKATCSKYSIACRKDRPCIQTVFGENKILPCPTGGKAEWH